MGCSNSQLRPIFRRCRRRRSKKEEVNLTPKVDLIERNGSAQDLLQGVQLLGASLRQNSNNSNSTTTSSSLISLKSSESPTTDSSAFCVPLLAQSEASTSQIDFFKMLDQKIEEGPDYDSEDEDRPLKRRSLPNSALRLDNNTERKVLRRPLDSSRASPLKFTNWNWDEDGD